MYEEQENERRTKRNSTEFPPNKVVGQVVIFPNMWDILYVGQLL